MKQITIQQKEQLITINKLMQIEELKAIDKYEKIKENLNQLVIDKKMWDYNIDLKLYCFTLDEALNKKHKTKEGDPFFEWSGAIYELLIIRKENPSWNKVDYFRDTALEDFQFCYLFYCILCYSNLTIKDILSIQSVWIEVKVDYQWQAELIKC